MPQTADKQHPQCAEALAALAQCHRGHGAATRWAACSGANQALAKCLAAERRGQQRASDEPRSSQQAAKAAAAAAAQQAAVAAAAVEDLDQRHERAELESDCFTIFHA
ncbi:hypothetical protein Rsub_06317 [Raphidocelis subcapitata]|uniref:COX assembly mitochondrial protein n=1 Tax=Raphidocelis subcapitata TaxID=307507 RepID=A0A2V0P8V9_9CHLO|nr:hypothetical protein Rsub_06317 [Raphidocelis subcapitata]|eukprot:GBF93597.1 hypothetical protein Rsub_06317 [Raphidocelis subcapitata]